METNFTHRKKTVPFKTGISILKIVIGCLVFTNIARAQNTDLPNPTANLQTAPTGTIVIAMDNTNQARPGYFNLKAYGLVVYLMNHGKRLQWVITAGKVKDGTDINVNARSIFPTVVTASSRLTVVAGSTTAVVSNVVGTLQVGMKITASGVPANATIASILNATTIIMSTAATTSRANVIADYSIDTYPVSNYNFKAGPFIILPSDTTGVRSLVNGYNSGLVTTQRVNVFQTTAATTVDIRYNLTGHRPKAAILADGGNEIIHINYMINAGIPQFNYYTLYSATGLTAECYTFASEPHNHTQGAFIDSLKKFVEYGGNFLAQCHALTSYDNWATGHFQSTNGLNAVNTNISANTAYQNADLSISQFEGAYNSNVDGSVRTWTFASGSNPTNNFYAVVKGSTAALANTFGVTGSKLKNGRGGNVYYLGNHDYNTNTITAINGQRMYMNAFLTPAITGFCPEPIILPVELKNFTARKTFDQNVLLNWTVTNQANVKEYIIERSADGVHFTELKKVPAGYTGNAAYTYKDHDNTPLNGNNFYRLVISDQNGKREYSAVVNVDMSIEASGSMKIYPNPAQGTVNIKLNDLPGRNQLTVVDMTGKTVINSVDMSTANTKLNISHLQSGTYIVRIFTADGKRLQGRLLVANNQ